MAIRWVNREAFVETGGTLVAPADVVLDIGPGIRPQTLIEPRVHICAEPYLPYIERVQREQPDLPLVFLNGTWEDAMRLLPAKSVDTVTALDVIEHMTKADGLRFLDEAARVARGQVVIFTPLGFVAQPEEPDLRDRWGMGGGHWQAHRSGWVPEDFAGDGWEFLCCKDFHHLGHDNEVLAEPFGALWAVRSLRPRGLDVARRRRQLRLGLKTAARSLLPSPVYRRLAAWAAARS